MGSLRVIGANAVRSTVDVIDLAHGVVPTRHRTFRQRHRNGIRDTALLPRETRSTCAAPAAPGVVGSVLAGYFLLVDKDLHSALSRTVSLPRTGWPSANTPMPLYGHSGRLRFTFTSAFSYFVGFRATAAYRLLSSLERARAHLPMVPPSPSRLQVHLTSLLTDDCP